MVEGAPTLEQILARCEPQGEHLLWTGGCSGNAETPRWCSEGPARNKSVRRMAYEHYHSVTLQPSQIVGTCEHPRCIAKGCLHLTSKAEVGRKTFEDEGARERHRAGVQRAGKEQRVLTRAQAELAKFGVLSARRTAEFLNCSPALVSQIRTGRKWRELKR